LIFVEKNIFHTIFPLFSSCRQNHGQKTSGRDPSAGAYPEILGGFGIFFLKNSSKLKKFPRRGVNHQPPPLNTPLELSSSNLTNF